MSNTYVESLSKKGYFLDGAREMCEYLHGKVKMYIVTNGLEIVRAVGAHEVLDERDVVGPACPRETYSRGAGHVVAGL